MSIQEMLKILRDNRLVEVAVDYDTSWLEGYKGLRPNTFIFVYNPSEFSESMNNCLVISESGNPIEANVKEAYRLYLLQKFALPHII